MSNTKPRQVTEIEVHSTCLYDVDELLEDDSGPTMLEAPDGVMYLVNTAKLRELVEHTGAEPVTVPLEAGKVLQYANEQDDVDHPLFFLWVALGNIKGRKLLYIRSISSMEE